MEKIFKSEPELEDGTTAVFSLNEGPHRLTAEEMSTLAWTFAAMRSEMKPPVREDAPQYGTPITGASAFGPNWAEGGITLSFRDPGLGWMHYRIPPKDIANLRAVLEKAVVPPPSSGSRH